MTVSKNDSKEILLSIENILDWTGGKCLLHEADQQATKEQICCGLFTDSRKVTEGSLFVALIGEKFNGNQFALSALEKGAAAVLVSEELLPVPGKIVIQVPDTLEALQQIARGYRQQFDVKLVAVTGSVGKTTTKDVLSWCLSYQYQTLKTEANHNNDIGVPETLFKLRDHHEAAVVEMGMRALGEIERLSRTAEPDAVIITNIAPVHLETLGSLENIAKAKCEIFSHLREDGWGMIWADHALLLQEARKTERKFYTFGKDTTSDCCLLSTRMHPDGMTMQVRLFDWEGTFSFAIPSEAVALDIVAAAGCAVLLGMKQEKIAQALAEYEGDKQRLHMKKTAEGGFILNDTYNANPLSMMAALDVLCSRAENAEVRKVAVLGDMYELGNLETEGHHQVGEKAAQCGLELLVTVGKLGQMIAEGALEAGMPKEQIHIFKDKESALPWLLHHVTMQDAVLFKSSHGLRLDILLKQWEDGGK